MSDDDIDTGQDGPIVTGEVAPAPSETPRAPVPPAPDEQTRTEQVREQFNAGLGLMAHGVELAEDYIKERQTQEKFLNDEDLSPAQMKEWHARTHTALQRALDQQARARGEVPPQQQQAPQQIPGYVPEDAPDYDDRMTDAQARFSRYFDDPTRIGDQNTAAEHKAAVTNWLTTYDPRSELAGYYLGSEFGPQMAEALAAEPQVIPYLLSLPRPQQAQQMAKLEGFLAARMQQQQSSVPRAPEPRRISQAPPPISAPRGGANPPKDLHGLAGKSDVSDYVKFRRAQERRCATR